MLMPMVPPGDAGLPVVNITYSSNTSNVNLFTAAGSPTAATRVNVTVNSGVAIYGTSSGVYAMDANGFTAGSIVYLECNGQITGYGGAGGAGGNNAAGSAGGAGGPGFRMGCETNITGSGTINAGGGGGGGGGAAFGSSEEIIGDQTNCNSSPWADGGAGGNGQRYNAAAQSGSAGQSNSDANGGTGGAGGAFGVNGSAGASGNVKGSCGTAASRSGGGGGSAGSRAIFLNGQTYTISGITANGAVS